MIQSRNAIKSNFQTGDYPTQQQFWDWIDSFLHRTEDTIEITNVRNLINELNNKADQQAFQQLWDLFQQLPNIYAAKDHTHTFASLTEKPSTLAGYGIINAYTKEESAATFAPLRHDHIAEDITDFNLAVEDIINALKNAVNGLAALDANGKLSNDVLPTLSTTEIYTPASEAEMLALVAQRGDFAVRTDTSPASVYILSGNDPSILSAWIKVSTAGGVLTVNGKSGPSVQLTTTDIDEGTRKYFTDALARAAFSAGAGINITPEGVISSNDNNLDAVMAIGNTTNNTLIVQGADNVGGHGEGLYFLHVPTQGSQIFSGDPNTGVRKNISMIGQRVDIKAQGEILFESFTGTSAKFLMPVKGSPAVESDEFIIKDQLNSMFSTGTFVPNFTEAQAYITLNYAYYVKTGKNVRIMILFDVANNLPASVTQYLISIIDLPFPVFYIPGMSFQTYKGYFGVTFADHYNNPGTQYQRLQLYAVRSGNDSLLTTAANEHWDIAQNKSVYIDITYITP